MTAIPKEVREAWDAKEVPAVLTTISKEGIPNTIYATCVSLFGENKILIANNKFQKTYENIMGCDKATFLFITREKKAYQLKGAITYKTEGAEFDDMKKWNRPDLAGKGVAIINVQEIYSGAKKICPL